MLRFILLIAGLSSGLLFIGVGSVRAQTTMKRLRGTVKDSVTGVILDNATLSLFRLPDTLLVLQTTSGRAGFSFHQQEGKYLLVSSFIGYKVDTIKIHIPSSDSIVQLRDVMMTRSSGNLMEVVIRTVVPPVIVKNDTIVYNTCRFLPC